MVPTVDLKRGHIMHARATNARHLSQRAGHRRQPGRRAGQLRVGSDWKKVIRLDHFGGSDAILRFMASRMQ